MLFIIVVLFFGYGFGTGHALHSPEMEIFQDSNLEELIYRGTVSGECKQLPPLSQDVFFHPSNCTMIYHSSNCTSFSHKLDAGVLYPFTAWMQQKPRNYASMSYKLCSQVDRSSNVTVNTFQPCKIPRHCFSFSASAIRYEMQSSIQEQHLKKVTLSAFDKFYNNGSGRLERTYNVKELLAESFRFSNTQGFSMLSSVTVGSSFTGEVSAEVTGSLGLSEKASVEATVKASLSATLSKTLGNSESLTQTNGREVLITNSKEWARSERITVHPCTEADVSSYVRMLKNVPVNYVVYFRIRGMRGRRVLTSAEIRKHFIPGDMTYITEENEGELMYRWNGTLRVTMGLQSSVTVHERKIESCDKRKNVTHTNSHSMCPNNSVEIEKARSTTLQNSTVLYPVCDCDPTFSQIWTGIVVGIVGTLVFALVFGLLVVFC